MICPNIQNEQVVKEFNLIVESLGGKALSIEEFKDGKLRALRKGKDYSAMEATYKIWHLNNGNAIDYTPNGVLSLLFSSLLEFYNGDTRKAVIAKSKAYSLSFRNLFGDWINNPSEASKIVDENGEPKINYINDKKSNNTNVLIFDHEFESAEIEDTFGLDVVKSLENNEDVTSDRLVEIMISTGIVYGNNLLLATMLSGHKVPVILDENMTKNKIAETLTDKDGNSVIAINPDLMKTVTKQYVAKTILHELVHAVTVDAITNPQTKQDKVFSKLNNKVYNTFLKYVPSNMELLSDLDSGLYAFSNEKEFAAVYITDNQVRNLIKQIAKENDKQNNGSLSLLIKDFINGITLMLANKIAFNTESALLEKYQNQFIKYLNNQPYLEVQDTSNMKQLLKLYKKINGQLLFNETVFDYFNRVQNYENALLSNALKIGPLVIKKAKNESQNYSYEEIANMLHTRLKALRASSKQDVKDRDRLILETAGQYEMFTNDFTSKYTAISDLICAVGPQILQDIDDLRSRYNAEDPISGEEYMYHAHSNIGTFLTLTQTLMDILNDDTNIQQMVDFYNKDKHEDEKITTDDVFALKNNVSNLNGICMDGVSVMRNILNRITGEKLKQVRNDVGASDLDDYINRLAAGDYTLDEDISILEQWAGATDASSSPLLRTLAYILGNAKEQAERESMQAMEELLDVSKGLNLTKIYERHNGKFTGYFSRSLKYGLFYQEYDAEIKRINKLINKKYNLHLELDNRIAPQENEDARIEWNLLRNKWLDEHALRKYNRKYYDAWAKLPELAKQALSSYNSEISMILKNPKYTNDKGRIAYELISEDDWKRLQHLWTLRKLLRSDYDMFGNKKEEGSESWKIKEALRQLDIDLYGTDPKTGKTKRPIPNKDYDGWLKARNEEIEACGGKDAYNKYISGEKNHGFNSKRFEKWDRRNSIRTLKRDETDGKALVFKKIDQEMRGIKINYGEEYDKLSAQADELLRPFKDDKGEVIAYDLPDSVKNLLLLIYKKQSDIKKYVLEHNKQAKLIAEKYSKIRELYVKYVDTEYFKIIKQEIEDLMYEDTEDEDYDYEYDDDLFNLYLSDYGTEIYDWESGELIDVIPYRWLRKTVAIDEQYMTYEPGNAWIEHLDDSRFLNKEFELESTVLGNQNVSMIPKRKYYDNKEHAELMKNKKYKKLYDATIKLNKKANEKQTNRLYTDDYLIPQISGTLLQRLKVAPYGRFFVGGKLNALFQWLGEKAGFKYNVEDDEVLGASFASDASTSHADQIFDKHRNNLRGKYPDGRQFNMIPQYYTRRMEDPSIISTDLLDIMHKYYLMSASYEQKSKVRGECDALLDMILYSRFTDTNNNTTAGGKNQDDSRTYSAARKFLEMNLYNIRRSNASVNLFGNIVNLQYTKSLELWKEYSTARNLGANPKVALVGMFTSTYVHLINQLVGSVPGVHDKYSLDTGTKAFGEVMLSLIGKMNAIRYAGDRRSKDKIMLIMEECNLSNQLERKYKYSDRNRGLGVLSKNYVYGFLTMCDFFIKSQIAVSEYMSYRFVDGEFITKSDLYHNRSMYGEELFKQKLKKFKNAKSLYSVLSGNIAGKKGKLSCDKQYEEAWQKVRYIVKNRAEKTAENADGMATQLQRNALSLNIVGALILMHRQYLPLMLQEAYGKQVYDYDTQRYKNGQLRTMFGLTVDLMKENIWMGILAGNTAGFALGGVLGMPIGTAAALVLRAYGIRQGHAQGKKNSLGTCLWNYFFGGGKKSKEVLKQTLGDFSSRDSSHKSYANRAAIARTVIEILMFNLAVSPAINAICRGYDDDDRWYIQFLLYCLRAFQWEAYTKYRTAELFNNIKTATGATGTTDALMEIGKETSSVMMRTLFDPRNNMVEPIAGQFNSGIFGDQVQHGAYKGWYKLPKAAFKELPWHNVYEQVGDPKSKRKYHENQIARLSDEEK